MSVLINKKQVKVRLIGIDAPEIGQKPWGEEAKLYLESIINTSGWKVKIEFGVEKTDQYGRILAYIRTTDGGLINLMMIRSGYDMLYTVPRTGLKSLAGRDCCYRVLFPLRHCGEI